MATPLRIILHVFQGIFLLVCLLLFVVLLGNFFDADDILWDAEYEIGVALMIGSALLSIAFSPNMWSVAKKFNTSAPPHQPNYGPVPPPTDGQAPPPPLSHQPPASYGR